MQHRDIRKLILTAGLLLSVSSMQLAPVYGAEACARAEAGTEIKTEAVAASDCDTEELSLPAGTVLEAPPEDWEEYFTSAPIAVGDEIYERIIGRTYRANPDIGLAELRYLKLLHYNYEGEVQIGELIVNTELAEAVLDVFSALYVEEYRICSMYLADEFWTGDPETTDEASMEADNTSCFNYRPVTGSGSLSKHALGRAIDLNPIENPYVKTAGEDQVILPEAGAAYLDRSSGGEHMITHEDLAWRLFTDHGFSWGGDWKSLKDYQHFES